MHKSLPPRICEIDGCKGRHKAHGLCTLHYDRQRIGKNKDPLKPKQFHLPMIHAEGESCALKSCSRPSRTKHLCAVHANNANRYFIPYDQYIKMHEDQNYKCAICGNEPSGVHGLSVDHDHITGNIRSLLCGNCNRMIGLAKENPDILMAGSKYLEQCRELCEV